MRVLSLEAMARRAIFFLGLVAGATASADVVMSLVDNYRDIQDARSATRTIYKSSMAGGCADIAYSGTSRAKKDFPHVETTSHHWTHADQDGWPKYHSGGGRANECGRTSAASSDDAHHRRLGPSPDAAFPGESPIDIAADGATATNATSIALRGLHHARAGLTVYNDGHALGVSVCGGSAHDCSALASFGAWPKAMRGLADATADTYYLERLRFHWGSNGGRGSEHSVCGYSAAAEMQFEFVNTDPNVTSDRRDPASGTKYVVLGTMIEGGAAEDNAAFASILGAVPRDAGATGEASARLDELLAADFDTKYFTYAGGLTEPPCSQQVTWHLAQNSVRLSNRQLDQLRAATTPMHGHDVSYKALFFPFVAIAMGTATEHVLNRRAAWVPFTVAVMVEGMALDWLASLDRDKSGVWPERNSTLQQSLDMWANMDGHLLLYAFLPALLFGDAMSLNTHMFAQVRVALRAGRGSGAVGGGGGEGFVGVGGGRY